MSSTADLSGQLPVLSGPRQGLRKLAAFVHADVVGYSALVGQDDAGTSAVLADIRTTLIDPALSRFGGRVVNTAGDSLLMEFGSVMAAVRCAFELQSEMPEFDDGRSPDRRVRFRMGVNIGDAITEGGNLHGDGVNIAARLQAVCPPGDLCVSRAVREEIRGRLGLSFEALGALELKNIAQPVEAFVIRISPVASAAGPPHRLRRALTARWGKLVALAALLLALGAATGWQLQTRQSSPGTSNPVNAAVNASPPLSIAVLPFNNMSSDPEQGYLADGISEDLTTDLSHLQGAFVIARESAFSFKGQERDVREIGRQLGVRYVLEGSVRRFTEAVRINAQLISTDTGAHIWAERFDEPIRDLAAGQDAIVERIGAALGTRLVQRTADRAAAASPGQPAAYDLVLRARAVLNEPATDERNTIAAGLFEQALRLDPHSVPALAGVASTLVQFYVGNRFLRRAANLIAVAERIAAGSPDVLAAKFLLQRKIGRQDESVATFRALLDVDSSASSVAELAAHMGTCRDCWGPPASAIPLLERILRLNPHSPANSLLATELGRSLIEAGRSNDAVGLLEHALAAEPEEAGNSSAGVPSASSVWRRNQVLLHLASAYAWSGRLDDARRTLATALQSPDLNDLTVRSMRADIQPYQDPVRIAQQQRIIEGLRMAGLPDHLDEDADSKVPSDSMLRSFENDTSPTPMTVPGGTTIHTADLVELLDERKPIVLTTASANPSVPGAILINEFNSGTLDDLWQPRLQRLMHELTGGDLHKPIVTFSYDRNHWHSRNLALRLIALGYTDVYWYRGGWEAWDAHNLPEAPVTLRHR